MGLERECLQSLRATGSSPGAASSTWTLGTQQPRRMSPSADGTPGPYPTQALVGESPTERGSGAPDSHARRPGVA